MTYRWSYSPTMDVYYLMGPWVAPDGRLDPREERQYAHIVVAPGRVHWACLNEVDEPTLFYDLAEAKAFVLASVVLR